MHKIEGSKGYYITEEGDVFRHGRKLKCNNQNSYRGICLFHEDGTRSREYVHRLVAKQFIPNPENKPFINHKDGNKTNNHVSNLEWVTNAENIKHAKDNNLLCVGTDKSDLYTDAQIKTVCRLLESGLRVVDISNTTNVCQKTISMIKNRKQWTHISKHYDIKNTDTKLSVDTVRWICFCLQSGKSAPDIVRESTNPLVSLNKVYKIKYRQSYIDISSDFNF